MKCKKCDNSTRTPNKVVNWREDQLCNECAHKYMPEKYNVTITLKTKKFGKESDVHGRYNDE